MTAKEQMERRRVNRALRTLNEETNHQKCPDFETERAGISSTAHSKVAEVDAARPGAFWWVGRPRSQTKQIVDGAVNDYEFWPMIFEISFPKSRSNFRRLGIIVSAFAFVSLSYRAFTLT